MNAEEHIQAAMADIHHDMKDDAEPLRDKLTQVLFGIRRWKRDHDKPRLAVVNHYRDRLAGIHIVDGDGDSAA